MRISDWSSDVCSSDLTDLPTLASLAEEAHAMEWRKGDVARPGAVFKGHNRHKSRTWSTMCTVTAAEPGRTFAFDVRSAVLPVPPWRYDIAPTGGGPTPVTADQGDQNGRAPCRERR